MYVDHSYEIEVRQSEGSGTVFMKDLLFVEMIAQVRVLYALGAEFQVVQKTHVWGDGIDRRKSEVTLSVGAWVPF